MYSVEIRIHEPNTKAAIARMNAMREWLDHHRFEPSIFRYTFEPPGLVFRVDFQGETEAVAFANDFGGRVMPIESAKSQGIAEAQHRSEANKGDRWEELEFGFSKLRVV